MPSPEMPEAVQSWNTFLSQSSAALREEAASKGDL